MDQGWRPMRRSHLSPAPLTQWWEKPGFSMGFMRTQPLLDRFQTTTTIHLTRNDLPTISTRSSASKPPFKSLTTHQNPRFFFPRLYAGKAIYEQKKSENEVAVKAYEQVHGPGTGYKKKKYVEPVLQMTKVLSRVGLGSGSDHC